MIIISQIKLRIIIALLAPVASVAPSDQLECLNSFSTSVSPAEEPTKSVITFLAFAVAAGLKVRLVLSHLRRPKKQGIKLSGSTPTEF